MSTILTSIHDFGQIRLAEGMDEEGVAVYVVMGEPDGTHGCACPMHTPHEQLGPLPAAFVHALEGRCAAPRADGAACRGRRAHGSRYCPVHIRQEARR